MNCSQKGLTRREWMQRSGVGALGLTVLAREVLGAFGGVSPNQKPIVAGVGVGGVGFPQLEACERAGFEIGVLCDVDDIYAKHAYDRWPQARRYRDWREMFQAEGDRIDAVYCGTPDHTHAVITMEALKRKKHTLCVKPLTRTVAESEAIIAKAREVGVATQVTASPNTTEAGCRTCELIWSGVIGPVREVHVWTNRPLWPQGMNRPDGSDPVPANFDWDLWLGPAKERPYKNKWPKGHLAWEQIKSPFGQNLQDPSTSAVAGAVYHPWNFRGWWDFGTGSLGDMGCHYLNTPYRAINLFEPERIHAYATRVMAESAPLASIVTYDFPAREDMPPVRVVWYDGGLRPPCPVGLNPDDWPDEGTLYVGDEGQMLGAEVLTPGLKARAEAVPKSLQRRGGTWVEWFEACQGGEPAGCNFDWAGPLTNFVLLGNIALRTGKTLHWDADQRRFNNADDANALLGEPYRSGWSL